MALEIVRRQCSVADYHRMAETEILRENERVELIGGDVIQMPRIEAPHAACVDRLNMFITPTMGGSAIVRVQGPIQLDDYSEPQPDLALLRVRDDFYRDGHPLPIDVLLVIEVADSSLLYDRNTKLPVYARAQIPEVWLVSVPDERIERYSEPVNGIYQTIQIVQRGQAVVSTVLPALTIAADTIFG